MPEECAAGAEVREDAFITDEDELNALVGLSSLLALAERLPI
jgi:hypothetical protein